MWERIYSASTGAMPIIKRLKVEFSATTVVTIIIRASTRFLVRLLPSVRLRARELVRCPRHPRVILGLRREKVPDELHRRIRFRVARHRRRHPHCSKRDRTKTASNNAEFKPPLNLRIVRPYAKSAPDTRRHHRQKNGERSLGLKLVF
jgi:hypothetical protein